MVKLLFGRTNGNKGKYNEHNFSILGGNMKNTLYGLIILACFIAAGTIDQQEAEQTQKLTQGE